MTTNTLKAFRIMNEYKEKLSSVVNDSFELILHDGEEPINEDSRYYFMEKTVLYDRTISVDRIHLNPVVFNNVPSEYADIILDILTRDLSDYYTFYRDQAVFKFWLPVISVKDYKKFRDYYSSNSPEEVEEPLKSVVEDFNNKYSDIIKMMESLCAFVESRKGSITITRSKYLFSQRYLPFIKTQPKDLKRLRGEIENIDFARLVGFSYICSNGIPE